MYLSLYEFFLWNLNDLNKSDEKHLKETDGNSKDKSLVKGLDDGNKSNSIEDKDKLKDITEDKKKNEKLEKQDKKEELISQKDKKEKIDKDKNINGMNLINY